MNFLIWGRGPEPRGPSQGPSFAIVWGGSVFFFGREKKSGRESNFWPFFGFFHGHFWLFTPTFCCFFDFFHAQFFSFTPSFDLFFRFFHGQKNLFHGLKKGKNHILFSFSRGKLCKFFTGMEFFFTGVYLSKFSRAKNAFHAHFFVKFQNFSREPFSFSRAKSRNIGFFSREPFHFSRPKKKKHCLGVRPKPCGQGSI